LVDVNKKPKLTSGIYMVSFTDFLFCRLTEEERRKKLKEERKERALEEKRKKVEERLKERAKLKEEKLRLAEFVKQWNRQREDLECEDLKVCYRHKRAVMHLLVGNNSDIPPLSTHFSVLSICHSFPFSNVLFHGF
jgi:hypothetical protein